MSRMILVLTLLVLAGCGVDGAPVPPGGASANATEAG